MKPLLAAALALVALGTHPAAAQAWTGLFADNGTCYARHYTNEHLAAHPRQRVDAIYLTTPFEAPPDAGGYDIVLDFGYTLAEDGSFYGALAYCRADRCWLEGDMGSFTVTPRDDGLRLGVESVEIEGRRGTSGDLAESDDKVFMIYRARPAACSFDG